MPRKINSDSQTESEMDGFSSDFLDSMQDTQYSQTDSEYCSEELNPEYTQTDSENNQEYQINNSPLPDDKILSQTDSENDQEYQTNGNLLPEDKQFSQTDSDNGKEVQVNGILLPDDKIFPQIDLISDGHEIKPPARKRKAKQPQSDITPKKRNKSNPIISIDQTRSVETSDDRHNNNLLDLVESLKGKKILSGTVQGVERSDENHDLSYAVIYHGDFKVIIPAEQMVDPPADFRDRSVADVMHYLLTKRLGAEIDYIVKGVDKTGIAAASRLEAMAQKRKEYYFGTDRDGNNLLHTGINAEARVVSVIRAGIFIDLFGLEVYIPLRELSYQRGIDAALQFQPGQRVLVKILTIERESRDNIQVTASVKQATENPYEKALRKYVAGNRYVGTVSMVDTNGVFVSLDGGIDCLCSYPKRGRPPRGSRVTVRILGINTQSNRIWGAITHMTTAR